MIRVPLTPALLALGEVELSGDEAHYLLRVRRVRPGVAIEAYDGEGLAARGEVTATAAGRVTLRLGAPAAQPGLQPWLVACLPLIKGERFDYALEKLVEVGVNEIWLWSATHAVVRVSDEKRDAKLTRWQAVVDAAARQCGRADAVAVVGLVDLATVIAWHAPPTREAWYFVPSAEGAVPWVEVSPAGGATQVLLLTGPEGGLAERELALLQAAGLGCASLGPRILRAETAPVVAVGMARMLSRT